MNPPYLSAYILSFGSVLVTSFWFTLLLYVDRDQYQRLIDFPAWQFRGFANGLTPEVDPTVRILSKVQDDLQGLLAHSHAAGVGIGILRVLPTAFGTMRSSRTLQLHVKILSSFFRGSAPFSQRCPRLANGNLVGRIRQAGPLASERMKEVHLRLRALHESTLKSVYQAATHTHVRPGRHRATQCTIMIVMRVAHAPSLIGFNYI
ncbi:hypothetical protein F5148DRAFT_199638 [Russula earlei]|uniref:Uncharacterized protein n=1 Tax=Russula earlei TaxID=71964 RepID=A0ACC0U760_9AGAM|nr:hypothetical protein F5148DRAFT_199638 [Russula earlei]